MKTNLNVVRTFLLTASLAGLTHTGVVSAASACKGLENAACSSNSACNWVEGYERKDGRTVKSFCRSKPSSKKSPSNKGAQKESAEKAAGKAG